MIAVLLCSVFQTGVLADSNSNVLTYVNNLEEGIYDISTISTKSDFTSEFAANGMYYPYEIQLIIDEDGNKKISVTFYTSSNYTNLDIAGGSYTVVETISDYDEESGKTKYYTTFEFSFETSDLSEYSGTSADVYTHYMEARCITREIQEKTILSCF
jgi:hypothetical protein